MFRSISTMSSIRLNLKSKSSFSSVNSRSITSTIFSSEFPVTPRLKHSFSVQASATTKQHGNASSSSSSWLSLQQSVSGTPVNSFLAPRNTLDSHPSTSMCSIPSGDNRSNIESRVTIGVLSASLFPSASEQDSYRRLPSRRALSLALAAGRTVPITSPTAAQTTSTVPRKLLAATTDRRKVHFSAQGSKATKRRSHRSWARACSASVRTVSPRWAPTSTTTAPFWSWSM
mmetsp:Transcript_15243/g.35132  ORF Transcript_15243/g.35132 Transcript_15243/m.35132 type:complete len:230 (-) Transcript_15243:801-1490(-)